MNCLKEVIDWAEKVLIVDSNSTDCTRSIATEYGAEIIDFNYNGGWPKKRQFVIDNYKFKTEWILLLDADEVLTDKIKKAIFSATLNDNFDGYYLWFKMFFLGRFLRFSDPGMRKLSLFRVGKGSYEMRYENQDISMGDMEVHEHVVVQGTVGTIKEPIMHLNYNSLSRFIFKHDQYSNYEAKVHIEGTDKELPSKFFGSFEQRRRFLKKMFIENPLSPLFYFIYLYWFFF